MRHWLDTFMSDDFSGMCHLKQILLITCLHGEPHLLAISVRARELGAFYQLPLKFTQSLPAFLPVGYGKFVLFNVHFA
jgi:hypothetical protein